MAPGTRKALVGALAALLFLAVAAPLAAAAWWIYDGGIVVVSVHEKSADGVRLWIPAPGALLRVGMALAPTGEIRRSPEFEQWAPIARVLASEVGGLPDGVLVEVTSPTESVRVEKRGRLLLIDVDDAEARIRVRVPAGVVASAASLL